MSGWPRCARLHACMPRFSAKDDAQAVTGQHQRCESGHVDLWCGVCFCECAFMLACLHWLRPPAEREGVSGLAK